MSSYISVLLSRDHLVSPFSASLHDDKGRFIGTLSTADKKTQTLALSLLFGGTLCLFTSPLTASLGSAFFFYSLAAKHKITRRNEFDEDIETLGLWGNLRVNAVLNYLTAHDFEPSEGLANVTFAKTYKKFQKEKVSPDTLNGVENILTRNPFLNVIRFLKNNGANLNMLSTEGYGLLFGNEILANKELVQLLIDNGCDVNLKGRRNLTPLISAVCLNLPSTAHLLLNNGADPAIATTASKKAVDFLNRISDPTKKNGLSKRL